MIWGFITRSLVLVLGYAYPAFQCFKTVEKNRVEIHELRFWCQYWIIVAMLTVLEKTGDILLSWFPMYGELKLALFIYLWYPKTKGTGYVYESFLRPYVSKHETDIDRSLAEIKDRAWDLAFYYWKNCTELGSTKILELLRFIASQSTRITQSASQSEEENKKSRGVPPPTPPSTPSEAKKHRLEKKLSSASNLAQIPKSESIRVQLNDHQVQYIWPEDISIPDGDIADVGSEEKTNVELNLQAARLKLRRSKGDSN